MNTRKRYKRFLVFIKTSPGLKIILFFVGVIFLSSFIVFIIERNRNEGFVSFFDSLWWTIVTISTVGYGDRLPNTIPGRIFAILTIFLGVAMMGTITGRIASMLMERQMKEEKGLMDYKTMSGHFIVCGWKQEMNSVLREILIRNPEHDPSTTILVNRAPVEEINSIRSDPFFKGIHYVHGDFIEEPVLKRAGIRGASKILVMADYHTEGDLQQIDSKTVMAVMSIKNMNKKAYVCAEILDTKFEKYLKISHCDEVLLSREFSRFMLASASSGEGLSHVVKSLLSKHSTARIKTIDFPESLVGKTYEQLLEHFRKNQTLQLVGLLENTGNIMLRKKEALREAQKNPDISKLVPELRNVKTLIANEPIINPPLDYGIKRYTKAIAICGTTFSPSPENAS
ncbi:MAG: transporter [Chitinivibrionales bacterium]|nr:transporter [Chitinivibrionales bacterium]